MKKRIEELIQMDLDAADKIIAEFVEPLRVALQDVKRGLEEGGLSDGAADMLWMSNDGGLDCTVVEYIDGVLGGDEQGVVEPVNCVVEWSDAIEAFRLALREAGFVRMFKAMRKVKKYVGWEGRALFWWMIADASIEDWMAIVKEVQR